MNKDLILPKGIFTVTLYDAQGNILDRVKAFNAPTTEGKNTLLDTAFGAATQITTWYIGLIDNSPSPVLLAADTLASHTGWSELVPATDYTGNRQEWVDAASSGGAKGTTSNCSFSMLTTKTVYGLFICSAASGTTGKLWSTGALATPIPVNNGSVLSVGYSLSL